MRNEVRYPEKITFAKPNLKKKKEVYLQSRCNYLQNDKDAFFFP